MSTNDIERIREILKVRHRLLRATREFFYARNYLEVETAHLMATAPPDPHIDPLEVRYPERARSFSIHRRKWVSRRLLRSGQ